MISLQACIICTLSTPLTSLINFSSSHIFSMNNSFVSNLAQGRDADIASAAATTHEIG
jgi:hypothetical protein